MLIGGGRGDEYVLRAPGSAAEWQAYHDLRREILFEARGQVGVYDENHPDEHLEGHYPLVLFFNDEAIGTIRVDLAGSEAVFRRVAIRADRQRAGHGRAMLVLAERFAHAKGCAIIRSLVDSSAVDFYSRCGFVQADASGNTSSVHMLKQVDGGADGSFDRQPFLKGELLELRPLRADDFEELFQVAADPLIWEQHPDRDRHQEETFREFFKEALASGGALVAIDRTNGRIIGSSRYHGYDAERGVVEIGWTFLARACWGGRYNGEMKRLMLEHAFKSVRRVLFIIGPDNRRSQRAVEKIGGVRAGTMTDAQGRERLLYELTMGLYARTTGNDPSWSTSMSDRDSDTRPATLKRNFILQQGLCEASAAGCPAQYSALLFQPRLVGLVVFVAVILQEPWVFLSLAGILWWSVLVPRLNPFDLLYNRILAIRPGGVALTPAPPPRRFAQGMAATFALGIGTCLALGWNTTAQVLEGFMIVALGALLLGGFCLGSYIFHLLRGRASFARRTLPWVRGA